MSGRAWTAGDLNILRERYPVHSARAIAAALGRSERSVFNAAYILGLRKSAEFYASDESGRLKKGESRPESEATQFKKGQAPANKGLRRPGWAPGRMGETQFKKGCRTGIAARNYKPVGTITLDTCGYLRIKVREATAEDEKLGFGNTEIWPFLHRRTWEQAKGPVPKGHVIVFKDRNRSNCAIENLECITRADLARRNTMWGRLPQELSEAIQLAGALKRKIRRLSNGEKQNVGPAQPSV